MGTVKWRLVIAAMEARGSGALVYGLKVEPVEGGQGPTIAEALAALEAVRERVLGIRLVMATEPAAAGQGAATGNAPAAPLGETGIAERENGHA